MLKDETIEHKNGAIRRRQFSRRDGLGSLQRAEILRHIDRIGPQHGQVDHLQRSGVRGGQHHRWRHTSLVGLRPTFSHDAPAIARSQTWKAIIRYWRDQVIADAALMIKKIRCHDRAHQVAGLSWSRAAAAVAIETGDWIATAGLQFGTEDIRFTIHSPSVNREAGVHRKARVHRRARVARKHALTVKHGQACRLAVMPESEATCHHRV